MSGYLATGPGEDDSRLSPTGKASIILPSTSQQARGDETVGLQGTSSSSTSPSGL